MAILNTVRAWNSYLLNVDNDPSTGLGASAGVNSLAIDPFSNIYVKSGIADTAWTLISAGGLQKGTKTIFCIDNGDYATGQDAINAASDGDTILFGAKSGGWGNLVIPAQKNLSLVGLQASKAIEVQVGTITFSPTVGTAVENSVYIGNLFSTASGGNLVFAGSAPARLRVSNCYFYNSGVGTTITSTNAGANSSAYFENCVLVADSAIPAQFSISTVYTRIYYCSIDRGSAINISGASVEMLQTQVNIDVAAPIVNCVSGTLLATQINLFRNTVINGSGISLDGTSLIVDSMNTYSIATGTGYCLLGNGTQVYGPIVTTDSIVVPANVNIQNSVVRLPLTLALTPVP